MKTKILFVICYFLFKISSINADWAPVNNGLAQLNVNTLCSYTSGGVNYIFAGTQFGGGSGVIFVSTNDGINWTVSWNIPNNVYSLSNNSNHIFAGTSFGMGYTTNNGTNWLVTPLPHVISKVSANNDYIFAGCVWSSSDPGGVYRSTDNGQNWTQTSVPTCQFGNCSAVTVNGNNVYVSTYCGTFISTDLGANWTQSQASFQAGSFVTIGNFILAGSSGSVGVYKSSDNGINWSQTSLSNADINALLSYNNTVFAAGGASMGNFFVSVDSGTTWLARSEGSLPYIRALCISDGYIFAGTDGYGIWRRPLTEIVGLEKISAVVPKTIDLKQNYPNPFNNQTIIEMNINKRDNYVLNIIDVLGRKVDTAFEGILESGTFKINYNADKLPSGVYFYSLKSNNYNSTKKFVLIK